MKELNQWVLWTLRNGKKLTVSPQTFEPIDAHAPTDWMSYDEAKNLGELLDLKPGFVFTREDSYFFLDLDHCYHNGQFTPQAQEILTHFPGCATELSQSGEGAHVFGTWDPLPHSCQPKGFPGGFYTSSRFVALTENWITPVVFPHLDLTEFVTRYVPPINHAGVDWSDEAIPEYAHLDNVDLLNKAFNTMSTAGKFGQAVTFKDLWNNEEDVLAAHYISGTDVYDRSSADAALAQHLAFWTGKNCERIKELMQQSELVRDKWEREDYLYRTILNAVNTCRSVYTGSNVKAPPPPSGLTGKSEKQVKYAEDIKATKLADPSLTSEQRQHLEAKRKADFWLTNKDRNAVELAEAVTPSEPIRVDTSAPERVSGFQFISSDMKAEFLRGCVYVQDLHKVFVPHGALLKPEQFNAMYGGVVFQMDDSGMKTTTKAFDALVHSQVVRFPRAHTTCFRPTLPPGMIVEANALRMVNTYVPIKRERHVGNIDPFLKHVENILPDEHDRHILLNYMAACVQLIGTKFQWCPVIQGTPGNGKTLISRVVSHALGEKYSHFPPASELAEKFNAWLFNKLFIGIEDIYVPESQQNIIEKLKPMITNDRLAMRAMQSDQLMQDVYANFIINMNFKHGLRKHRDDRRFCVFYTAQQCKEDLDRFGMNGDYFKALYGWLKTEGYDYLTTYLADFQLDPAINFTGHAPVTSATEEAISEGLGSIEQEILEAIDEGRPGFRNGMVSSIALTRLLKNMRAERIVPPRKRRELMSSLGYEYHKVLGTTGQLPAYSAIDAGRPRLYVKLGHIVNNFKTASEIQRYYEESQDINGGAAQAAFGEVK